MSGAAVTVTPLTQSVRAPAVDPRLRQAAREFEAVFVRQLLQSTKLASMGNDRGHGAMVLDSLAQAVTAGNGLGLAAHIEQMLRDVDRAQAAGTTANNSGIALATAKFATTTKEPQSEP